MENNIPKNPNSIEGIILLHAKTGDKFYTSKAPAYMTALAHRYKRDVRTAVVMAICYTQEPPELQKLTQVILL